VKRKWIWFAVAVPVILILCQLAYFMGIYQGKLLVPDPVDLVLVYSGDEDRASLAQQWSGPKGPLFLFSGFDYSQTALDKEMGLGPDRINVEDRAKTTDQNARFSAPMLRRLGVHSVLLALPWYHLPRALFLTQFYLIGSGITVTPFATEPVPEHWWATSHFHTELLKFWGSIFRIGLSWIGIDDWPPHFGG
jgi:uncharacterized SAM-binding protein YcdF (DUF218 family)